MTSSSTLHEATNGNPGQRRKKLAVGVVAVLGLFIAAAAGTAWATGSGSYAALSSVSNSGERAVALLPSDAKALQRFSKSGASLAGVTLLATRQDRSFYRIENSSGADCFGVGPAEPTDYVLGQIQCAREFPSSAQPIVDFSVMHGTSKENAEVWRSEGIASNGVAQVAFRQTDGSLTGTTAVVDNVYEVQDIPAGTPAALVALGAGGNVVAEVPLRG